eukprot:3496040-Pleurochrysis_carterae.AAC.2
MMANHNNAQTITFQRVNEYNVEAIADSLLVSAITQENLATVSKDEITEIIAPKQHYRHAQESRKELTVRVREMPTRYRSPSDFSCALTCSSAHARIGERAAARRPALLSA